MYIIVHFVVKPCVLCYVFLAKGEHGLQHHPACLDVDHGQIGILDGCGRAHQTCLGDGMMIEFFALEKGTRNQGIVCSIWCLLGEFDFRIIKRFAFCKRFCSCGLGWNIKAFLVTACFRVFFFNVEIALFSLICSESFFFLTSLHLLI